jgi:5-amino-6-(5-phosphoribosylamino)uracil reductase
MSTSRLRRLLPDTAEVSVADQLDELRFAELAPPERPYLVTNFALTVDGRATISGRAGPIGTDTDTDMLMELRSTVDAVLIGAGTMRVERYGRIVPSLERRERRERRGLSHDPLAVIVSGTLDLPWDAELFTAGEGEILLITSSQGDPPDTATPVKLLRHPGRVDLAAALAHMRRELGVSTVLCEGGPRLHGELLASELVDELFITTGPKLAGGGGLRLAEGMPERVRQLDLVWLLADGSELFCRYRLQR